MGIIGKVFLSIFEQALIDWILFRAAPHAAKVHGSLETDAGKGKLNCEYSWLKAENIAALIYTEYQLENDTDHHARAELFYKHPNRNLKFVSTGIDFELDRIYRCVLR